jgi:AcrR family transcriptional regulator
MHAARHAFAELGYVGTSNKVLAEAADVTTGAIYHYFQSKLDLYRAVYDEVQSFVYARFDAIVDEAPTFRDGLDHVLDAAHEMNNDDPSLARFLGAVRIDLRRTPELRGALEGPTGRRDRFVANLVERGVTTGELAPADADRAAALILSLLIGLVDAVSDSPVAHRSAVDAIKLLVAGELVRPPRGGAR